jgi:hypothetical protein
MALGVPRNSLYCAEFTTHSRASPKTPVESSTFQSCLALSPPPIVHQDWVLTAVNLHLGSTLAHHRRLCLKRAHCLCSIWLRFVDDFASAFLVIFVV